VGGVCLNCKNAGGEGGGKPEVELFERGSFGGGGVPQSSRVLSRPGQSVSAHRGLDRGEPGVGRGRKTRIGTCSDPVDRRELASHSWNAGKI